MGNPQNEWIKEKWKQLIQSYGGRCEYCGTNFNIEFAHIKPTGLDGKGRGRKERYYDIIRNPDSYMLLCGNVGHIMGCHKKYDSGILTLDEIIFNKNKELYIEPR